MTKLNIIIASAALLFFSVTAPVALAGKDKKDHAVTAWAFIFNNPENCVGPCNGPDLCPANGAVIYLTGQRVQKNGRATFAGQISANSLNGVFGPGPCPNNGLIDPIGGEIHIGLDDHGPGSLSGNPDQVHMEVTNPANPANIRQFATFLPAAAAGNVTFAGTQITVPGSAARISRTDDGVSISIDTHLDFDDDSDSDSDSDSD